MKNLHYNIQVIGKVQGVWFRKYTHDKAKALGLFGFVKNEPNGNVYIEVSGKEQKVKNFIKWLYQGSPQSKVTSVICTEMNFKGFEGFEIID